MSLGREQWSLCGPRGPQGWAPEQVPLELHGGRTKDLAAPLGAAGPLLISLPPKWGVFTFHVANTGTHEKTKSAPSPSDEIHLASQPLPSCLFFPFLSQANPWPLSLCLKEMDRSSWL